MKQFKLYNNIFGWLAFLIAAITYTLTMEPTASFWDCGEFITTAFRVEVGHPPGAPLFMIMARFFSLFAGDPSNVAVAINFMSALASGFTILFLFWSITHIARKIVFRDEEVSLAGTISIIGAGLVGALAYTFSDTFWFSAVEAEVYASSSLFTAAVFWAILKWEEEADQAYANRWIILIAYLVGLSIGVHLLNLLAIPAIIFVYYFKKYEVSRKGIVYASIISVVLLGGIMYFIIPYIVVIASWFELLFVNTFGLPFNSGNIFYLLLLAGLIVYGLYNTHKKNKVVLNTIILGITVILIGYSSFTMVIIRSLANPPMDQNNPETVFNLLSYLNREQYGDRPLVYGQSFNSPLDAENPYGKGSAIYIKKDGKYVVTDRKDVYNYDSRFKTLFPRMWSSQQNHIDAYKEWSGFKGSPVRYRDRSGETKTIYKPTFLENLRFLISYQIGHMYLRYLMWNFVGRQNDIQGHGEVTHGNWISGISFIDNARLGNQDLLPDELKNNRARNKYYFIPLIFGLIGMFYLFKKNYKDFTVVTLLFLFTGLAIVVYLNQYPFQPRERDYAYAGSFYAFTIYIGLGVLWLIELLKRFTPGSISAITVSSLSLLAVPVLMANQNWDDHNRSGRYTARDFAYNYLNSCDENAILFTNGDNDTFPLWYAQEVEGIRTDVRVCNLSYLSTDWYIDQMKHKAYDSEPVPFSMTHDQYVQGKRDYVPLYEQFKDFKDLGQIIDFVKSDNPQTKVKTGVIEQLDFIPSKKLRIPVDKKKILDNGIVNPRFANRIVDNIDWKLSKNFILKNDLMVLDLLGNFNWDRPVYWAITVPRENYVKLENYFQVEGLTYKLVPINTPPKSGQIGMIDSDKMYENMVHKFHWGGIDDPDVYLDENNIRMLMNFRSNFGRLGLQLVAEGDTARALEVADKCVQLMPNDRVPFNYFNVPVAEVYFQCNKAGQGKEILEILFNKTKQELDFYFQLDKEQFNTIYNDARRSLALLQEVLRISTVYGQNDLQQKVNSEFEHYKQFVNYF